MIGTITSFLRGHALTIYTTLVVAAVVGLLAWGEVRYKQGREAGVLAEASRWKIQLDAARNERDLAQSALDRVEAERDQARQERDRERARRVGETIQEIENAQDTESRYAAYLALRNSLREQTAGNHARARADYLSSISDGA